MKNVIGNKELDLSDYWRVIEKKNQNSATIRKNKNYIFSLQINDQIEFDQVKIFRHINEYYRNLIGISEDKIISLSLDF
jgi:hypothetical protein